MPPQVVNMDLLRSADLAGRHHDISNIKLNTKHISPSSFTSDKLNLNASSQVHTTNNSTNHTNMVESCTLFDGMQRPTLPSRNSRRQRRRYSQATVASRPLDVITRLIFPGGPSNAFCNEETLSSSFLILDGFMTIALGNLPRIRGQDSNIDANVLKDARERWGKRLETNICVGKVSYEYRLSDEAEQQSLHSSEEEEDSEDENQIPKTKATILSQHLDRIPLVLDQEPTDGVAGMLNPSRYIPPSQKMFADALRFQEYDQAVDVYEEILEADKERYGETDLVCAIDLHNLGVACLLANDLDSALYYFQESVLLKRNCLGHNDSTVSDSLVEIGIVLYNRNDDKGALRILNESLEIYKHTSNSEGVGRTCNNIGCVYNKMGDVESAITCLQEALVAQRLVLGMSEKAENSLLNFALTQANLGYLKVKAGHSDAVAMLEESLLVLESVLGDDNVTVCTVRSNIAIAKHNPTLENIEDVDDLDSDTD